MCKCSWKYGLPYSPLSVSLYTIVAFIKRYGKSYNLGESLHKTLFQRKGTSFTAQWRWIRTTLREKRTRKLYVKIIYESKKLSRECKQWLSIRTPIDNLFCFWTCPVLVLHRFILSQLGCGFFLMIVFLCLFCSEMIISSGIVTLFFLWTLKTGIPKWEHLVYKDNVTLPFKEFCTAIKIKGKLERFLKHFIEFFNFFFKDHFSVAILVCIAEEN